MSFRQLLNVLLSNRSAKISIFSFLNCFRVSFKFEISLILTKSALSHCLKFSYAIFSHFATLSFKEALETETLSEIIG